VSVSAVATGQIRARNLGRRFEIRTGGRRSLKEALLLRPAPKKQVLWALRHLDLDVNPGETLGVVGKNGSGKSTLLSLIARIFAPSEGSFEVGGEVGSLLELGAGFHPEFTGIENVYLNAAIHGLEQKYVTDQLEEIIGFAELEEFAHMPVKTYSSGMYVRLGFSVAVHVRPDVLLVDEVLAVGDTGFQHKCYEKISEFKERGGTLVFVSHDLAAVENICDRAILLERGRVLEQGSPERVLRIYQRDVLGVEEALA
jgi:ABC-type polysaccharide/polyol phosphate transport system ATPase subunit